MYDKLPSERQPVEVRLENQNWQPATYVDGKFIDAYGMPLNPQKILGWRGADRSVFLRHESLRKVH